MEDEAMSHFMASQIIFASLCYTYFIASKFPKGIFRLFSLLPIFTLFTLLPLYVSTPLPSLIFGWFITWISNFKLLLYSFNLGPLSTIESQRSFFRFIFLAAFPITIKSKTTLLSSNVDHNDDKKVLISEDGSSDVRNLTPSRQNPTSKETAKVMPLNFWSKSLLFILLDVVYYHKPNMVVLCFLMYLSIDIAFGICALLVKATLGLELEPPSDDPYLSTSLQDFWGRRWNRMVSAALRDTVYKPMKSTAKIIVGRTWAHLVAVMGTFIVSGLLHELIYYYTIRVKPTWEVTWFFILHGVCVILEVRIKKVLGQKWKLHWVISGPMTVGFVMVTGFWLFFPQLLRNHVDTEATEDIMALGNYFKDIMKMRLT